MFGRSIIKHSQRSITRDILCLSRSSAAASACAQSHGKLKKKKKKSAQHTHAVCQAVVASASRPVGKKDTCQSQREAGVGGGGQELAILDSKRKSSSNDIKEQER